MDTKALHTRLRDERGAVALIGALSMTAVLGMTAMVTDLGALYIGQRNLQAATDASALSATYPVAQDSTVANSPQTFAQNYLTENMPGANLVSAVAGTYCPDSTVASGSRFTAGSSVCADNSGISGYNAVRVTSSITSPLYFARALTGGATSETLGATATAAQINEAGFYAGSGVLSLATMNNAVLNALLPGSTVNLASYSGIVGSNINALTFLNALATNLNLSAGNYSDVLKSTVTVQQVLQSEIDALNAPGSVAAANAVTELATLKASVAGSPSLLVSNLLDLGVWQNVPVGSTNASTALNATLNAYQLATLTAQVANGANAVAIPTAGLGIPGIATLTAASSVIEPPQSPPFVFSPVGTAANPVAVHTAQVRLQLNLQLLSALSLVGLGSAPVNLPIYIEAGSGDAKLTDINCGYNPLTDATVQIQAESGVANAYIGTVTTSAMSNFSTPVTVQPATLVNLLNIVQVTGSSQVSVGSAGYTTLTFNQTEMQNLTPQTVTSTGMLSNLLQTLGSSGNLSLSVLPGNNGLGVPLVTSSAVLALLSPLLTPAFAGLDPLVDNLLASLGIKVGYLDVTASGVRCGVPTLVN